MATDSKGRSAPVLPARGPTDSEGSRGLSPVPVFLFIPLGLTLAGACGHAAPPPSDVAPAASAASAPPADADASLPQAAAPVPEGGALAVASPEGGAVSVAPAGAGGPSAPVFETQGPTYPADQLRVTFDKSFAKLKACFEPGRKRDPRLRGRVIVKFTIGHDGKPSAVQDQGSNLEDPQVIACVVKTVKGLRFPKPEEGSVTVTYPFIFHPTEPFLILPESAPGR
jgi:hypothetical protein